MKVQFSPTHSVATQVKALGLYQMGPSTGVLLYKFFNADYDLLYVGVTCSPVVRWQAHKNRAKWWAGVRWLEVEKYPHNAAALEAERLSIRQDGPRFNLRSFPGRSRNRPGIARESAADEAGANHNPVGPYARAGARATRRVRDRRQETGAETPRYRDVVCGLPGDRKSHHVEPVTREADDDSSLRNQNNGGARCR